MFCIISIYVVSIRSTIDHSSVWFVCACNWTSLMYGHVSVIFYDDVTIRMDGWMECHFCFDNEAIYETQMFFLLIFRLYLFVEGEIGFYVRSRLQSNSFDVVCLARVYVIQAQFECSKSKKQIIFLGHKIINNHNNNDLYVHIIQWHNMSALKIILLLFITLIFEYLAVKPVN